jgi:hypothetical protein
MTLDDQLRDALRHAVEVQQLREDDAFDSVWRKHRHGLVRGGTTREAIAAAVALTLLASVAMVVSWRNTPDRFRSTATVRVAVASSNPNTGTAIPALRLPDARTLALAPSTRQATLRSAHLSPDDTRIDFRATFLSGRDLLSMVATAPSANDSTAVTREWVSVFTAARRIQAISRLEAMNRALLRRVTALHQRLREIDAELVRIDPKYKGVVRYNPTHHFPSGVETVPSVPEPGSIRELNLANQRVQILALLADLGADSARNRIILESVRSLPKPVAQAPAVRVDASAPATVPILVGWAIGLVVVLAGALLVYRRRTRPLRQVSA